MVVALTMMVMLPSCIESLLYASRALLSSVISLCVHEEGVTIQPHHLRCGKHVRRIEDQCCSGATKCQMSKSLRPLPSRAGPLPRFPEEHPPAPRLGNDCKPNSQVLADPRLLVFRHPLSLATKVTSCTLMRNQISAQGHHLSQNEWMLPPTLPKAALDHAGGRVFSVR